MDFAVAVKIFQLNGDVRYPEIISRDSVSLGAQVVVELDKKPIAKAEIVNAHGAMRLRKRGESWFVEVTNGAEHGPFDLEEGKIFFGAASAAYAVRVKK